jgi:deoxyadenosine/deoxycytidine kinase
VQVDLDLLKSDRKTMKNRVKHIGFKIEQFRSNEKNMIKPMEDEWFKNVKESNKLSSVKIAKEKITSPEKIADILNK